MTIVDNSRSLSVIGSHCHTVMVIQSCHTFQVSTFFSNNISCVTMEIFVIINCLPEF